MRTFLFFENSIVAYGAFEDAGKTDVFYGIKPGAKEKKLHQPFLAMMKGLEKMEFAEQVEFIESNKDELHIRKLCYSYNNKLVSIGEQEPPLELVANLKEAVKKDQRLEKDSRIDTGFLPEKVRTDLVCLTEGTTQHKPLMSEVDFEYFLRTAFRGFAPISDNRVIKVGNGKRRGMLRYFLYLFSCDCGMNNRFEFCKMYQRVFAPELTLESIEKHFADPVNLPSHLA